MPERLAVVIGINYSDRPASDPGAGATRAGLSALQFAEADAGDIAATLNAQGYQVETLLGAAATRAAIIKAIRQQSLAAGQDGLLIVYFAGHGAVDPSDPRIAYLLPADVDAEALDVTAIPLEDLPQRHLGRAASALTLLDCCHSGYAAGLRDVGQGDELARDFQRRVQNTFGNARGRVVLTACAGDQKAREVVQMRHGIFTYYILDWWRKTRETDDYSLASYVSAALEREGVPLPVRSGLQEGRMLLREPAPAPTAGPGPATAARLHIFIGYKHDAEPDQGVAQAVGAALGGEHAVFLDEAAPASTTWAQRVEAELQGADVLIPFLSAQSVGGEMLLAEVRRAAEAAQAGGRPAILPVRLAYGAPFAYPLDTYLAGRACAAWRDAADTPRLVADLRQVLAGGPLPVQPPLPADTAPELLAPAPFAQPAALERPEGTMNPQSGFYVERRADAVARAAIKTQGVTLTIKGPRQMGKSSLLTRLMREATAAGKRVAFLDFQRFDQAALENEETFLRQFCALLGRRLKIEDRVAEYWAAPLGNIQRCSTYLEEYLLPAVDGPLVLALDEVDRIFETPFRSDFFGMLRSWHNDRAVVDAWRAVDLALVTSTEPYQLIANLNQSPFNVGENIELEDFTAGQVADLNRRHGTPLPPEEERRLTALTGGQPYLVRRALYLLAAGLSTPADLVAGATADKGPFGDHLRYHLFRLHEQPELVEGLRRVLRGQPGLDERLFFRLQAAGLVKREGAIVVPRCELYAAYFRERLGG